MTTQFTFPMNDMVLRLAGGHRDGELIPVKTMKCFLGTTETSEDGAEDQPQCAIFRGPNGAAVRSYGDDVSVNGVAATVHWLKEGDRIEFPNSMTVEVAQLGWVESTCEEHQSAIEQTNTPETETSQEIANQAFEAQSDHLLDDESADCQLETEIEQPPEAEMFPNECQQPEESQTTTAKESRFDTIESQVQELQTQNDQIQQRFDQLESQLVSLSEQLSQLATAPAATAAPPSLEEESFMTLGNQQQLVQEQLPEPACEEVFMDHQPAEPVDYETADSTTDYQSLGDFYSHQNDDDEKIMTFDSESDDEELNVSTSEAEVTDAQPEINGVNQGEINSRLSEMERVFGGSLAEADEDATESTTEQSANEQPIESFESPAHSLNDQADSFAENTLTAEEPEEAGFASQLMHDALDEEPRFEESPDEETEIPAEETEIPVEETQVPVEATQVPVEATQVEESVEAEESAEESSFQSSSVADLLAKMQAEGQWGGIPDDNGSVEPTPEPIVEAPIEPVATEESGEDVDDYMSQLLNRMRGGEAPAPKPVAAAKAKETKKPDETPEEEAFVAPENPLRPDEFKPARKAQKIELSAMRELANSTSRNAVHASEKVRLKELGYVQIGIAVCSFLMSIYYFLWNSQAFFDTGFFVGFICIGLAGFLGYRFFSTMKYNEKMDQKPKKKSTENNSDDAEQSLEPATE